MIGYTKIQQVGIKKKSQTEKNIEANKELDIIYAKKGINYCELPFPHECIKIEHYSNGVLLKLTYAHRHKRDWYKEGRQHLLYSFNETVRACLNGHVIIEADAKLTNKVFMQLRGTALTRKESNV